MRTITSRPRARTLALLSVLPVALAACSNDPGGSTDDMSEEMTATETIAPSATAAPTEAAAAMPRIVITYDGGIQVLDANSFEVEGDVPLDGFNRLNAAGDGRHVLVSTTGGFQVLDAGTWAEPHGDHDHYYVSDPLLTDVVFKADKPGHVVVHEGRTALFDDATGNVVVQDSDRIAEGIADDARALSAADAHHGVAVELTDGTLIMTEGTEDERSTVRALDADGKEIASIDTCPGVHGEATAAGEVTVLGCEDGVVIFKDGKFIKTDSKDDYGRIGNQAGSEESPIVLGDYKVDADAELERPTRISLIDTRSGEITLVDLPSSYTFRSIARGDDGEALVLGTDGSLHVIDPISGKIVRSIELMEPWEEPMEWQQPRPAIAVHDGSAYVTDPAMKQIHAVDIETGEIWKSTTVKVTPNEIEIVTGEAPDSHGEHADEKHSDDDHSEEEHSEEEHSEEDHEGHNH